MGRPEQYSGIFRATRKYIADTSSSNPRNVCVFLEFSQIILQNVPCVVVWDCMNFMLKKYCFGENALILKLFKLTANINMSVKLVPGSRFLVPGSRFLVPGSWFPVPGSLIPVPGSRFLLPCSCFPVPCSWCPVPGSLFLVPGSWFPFPASRFPLPRSRFLLPCSLFPVHCSRFLVLVPWSPFPGSYFPIPYSRVTDSQFPMNICSLNIYLQNSLSAGK